MRLAQISAITALMIFGVQAANGQALLNQLEQRLQGPGTAPAGADPAAGAAGYLGAELDDEGEQGKGIRVTMVRPGAPADKGGLKAGDLITAINGKAVKDVDGYDKAKGPPGTTLQMTVERAGRPQAVTVTLGARPAVPPGDQNAGTAPAAASPTLSPPGGSPTFPPPATSPALSPPTPGSSGAPASSSTTPSLNPPTGLGAPATGAAPGAAEAAPRGPGITATPLPLPPPPGEARGGAALGVGSGGASLGITVETYPGPGGLSSGVPVRRGAVITAVKPGSPAEQAGLPVGAVIVLVDGRPVNASDDLVSTIRTARPGQEVELTYYEGDRMGKKSVRLAAAGAMTAPPVSGGFAAPGGGGYSSGSGALGSGVLPGPSATPAPANPPAESPLRLPRGGGNRPLIDRVERMVDNFSRPPAAPAIGPTGPSTVYNPVQMAELQRSVAELTNAVHNLEERLKAIEGRQGGSPSAPTQGFGTPPATPGATPGFAPAPGGTGTNP